MLEVGLVRGSREHSMSIRILFVLPILCAFSVFAQEAKPVVSLILTGASAKQWPQEIHFHCDAVLDNATGKNLTVRSNFASAFDGLELVVTTRDGKVLAQQGYTWHQSPFTSEGRDFPVKQGITKGDLVFPIRDLPANVKTFKVRLVGTLPGSGHERILSSETIEVTVKE
jgi:hypothetical protein